MASLGHAFILFLSSMDVSIVLLRSELMNVVGKEDGGGLFGFQGLVGKRTPKGVEDKDQPYLKMKE